MINQEFLDKVKETATTDRDICEGLFFGFLMSFREQFPYMNQYMLDGERSVIPYEKLQPLSINLCQKDIDGINRLKIPLFGEDASDFSQFIDKLSDYYVTSKGHSNNPTQFSIFGETDRSMFQQTKNELGKDYTLEKLAIVTANYYEVTTFPTKLSKFLGTPNVISSYKEYVRNN